MHILTFAALFPNSLDPTYGIFVYQRSAHLARLPGNKITVVAPVAYFPKWIRILRWSKLSRLPARENIGSLQVHHPRYFLLPRLTMAIHGLAVFAGSLTLVKRLHRNHPIDLIDAHFVYPYGFAAILLGRALGVPVAVSARGTDINLYPSYKLIRPMIRWTLRAADTVIAVSDALKQRMLNLGVDSATIRVIPNGVDAELFRRIPSDQARMNLGIVAEQRIIVSVGALIPLKGHDILIRAFAKVRTNERHLRLCILGEGSERAHLEQLVQQLGLQDVVQLIGRRPNEELPIWFSAAQVSCLASEREGWPNVVSESLACGTPVVGTRVGGIPEIIHSPELGVLVNRTVDDVAEGLRIALAKNWDRDSISMQTRARTWTVVASELQEAFIGSCRK